MYSRQFGSFTRRQISKCKVEDAYNQMYKKQIVQLIVVFQIVM